MKSSLDAPSIGAASVPDRLSQHHRTRRAWRFDLRIRVCILSEHRQRLPIKDHFDVRKSTLACCAYLVGTVQCLAIQRTRRIRDRTARGSITAMNGFVDNAAASCASFFVACHG
jgi:hypothetical protein